MPKVAEGKVVTLYLESWQKRMIRDYLKGIKFKPIRVSDKITIDFSRPVHLNTYRVPFIDPRELVVEFYFTDAQKMHVQEATGLKVVDTVRLTKAMLEEQTVVLS